MQTNQGPKEKKVILRGVLSRDKKEIAVHCPYCDRYHLHGWNPGDNPRVPQHRTSHCDPDLRNPIYEKGYYIAPMIRLQISGFPVFPPRREV